MDESEFRDNFSKGVRIPKLLLELLEFQNANDGFYSGGFELDDGGKKTANAWFRGDAATASCFALFAHEADDSWFGFWLYDGRTLANAPIVCLGGEGGAALLANSVEELLSLLAVGGDQFGEDFEKADEPADGLGRFRTPLGRTLQSPFTSLCEWALDHQSDVVAAQKKYNTHVQQNSDGAIASVCFDFVFLVDGKKQNRGSETWVLVKASDGRRIAAIRALIVDDEAPARQRISDLLKQDSDVRSLQEAGDSETAVRMIRSENTNLVLLAHCCNRLKPHGHKEQPNWYTRSAQSFSEHWSLAAPKIQITTTRKDLQCQNSSPIAH